MKNVLILAGLASLACALIVPPSRADSTVLYSLSFTAPVALYTVETTTGKATFETNSPTILFDGGGGMAYLDGQLYACDLEQAEIGGLDFGTIDRQTGVFTVISEQDGSANWHCLTANPTGDDFYTVDAQNNDMLQTVGKDGTVNFIGSTGENFQGIAYDSTNSILYGLTMSDFYTIDTTTGASTLIGSLGITGARDLALDPATGTFFADSSNSLYTIDPSTGTASLVGAAGAQIDDLGFAPFVAPIPEASTMVSFGLLMVSFGLLMVFGGGMMIRRRKNALPR